jgi:hypothetical protein
VNESRLANLASLEFTKLEEDRTESGSKESKAELDDSQMNGRLGWQGDKVRSEAG